MSLVSRVLESAGISTVIAGSALDIIQHVAVPRYLHSDLPLGNPCGVPFDKTMQAHILNSALDLFTNATAPQTIARSNARWPNDFNWQDDYSKVDDDNREALRKKGEERRLQQFAEKQAGVKRASMIK